MAIRQEVLRKILNDADTAKPIPGEKNVYSPDDYAKIKNRQDVLAMLDEANDNGFLEPKIPEGAVEFDTRGNLKKIGRTQPRVIDPRRLTANRYLKEIVPVGKTGQRGGTYILVAFGGAITHAFENMTLSPQVKVYRFFFDPRKQEWVYVRAELIEDKRAYSEMTNSLNGASALSLIHKIEEDTVKTSEVEGDDLSAILTKSEKTEDSITETAPEENNDKA